MAKNADRFDEIAETYDDGLRELLGTYCDDIDRFASYKIEVLKHTIGSSVVGGG